MNAIVNQIVQEVPELSKNFRHAEVLSGGLCNHTYKITTDENQYVLRINGNQNEYLGLTRQSEVEIMCQAHRAGIAPSVIADGDPGRYVVTSFLESRMITREDLQDEDIRRMIIDRLKKIHLLDSRGRSSSPYQLIHGYLKGAELHRVKQPEGLSGLLQRVEEISYSRSADKVYNQKFCHNDFFACNLLYDGTQLQVIDWELSGSGDIFFDLAIIPFSNRFSEAEEREWLKLYFGDFEEEQYLILQDMKFMNMVREVAWGLLFSGLQKEGGGHDFDYYRFAEESIEKIKQGIYYL